jgi:hypothetical protein
MTFESARALAVPPDGAADQPIRSRQAFCLALKAARERRGVTLAQIAETTKVCASHFAALERHDLRRWPKGLFRRAFFRGYVGMIGLPVAETMDEFVRLFPDDEGAAPAARPVPAASPLRLSLDVSWHGPRVPIASRAVHAAIDAGAVAVLSAVLSWWAGAGLPTTAAITSLGYFTLATVLLGGSPAAWVVRWRRARASAPQEAAVDAAVSPRSRLARAWRRSVEVAGLAFGSSGDDTSEAPGVADARIWTTDARRVGPRDARLRVRFKLSP